MIKRVSDKELKKWLELIGSDKIIYLYIDSKLYLSSQQLDYLIKYRHETEGIK